MNPHRGMLLALRERDYRFGSGPLLCKIGTVLTDVKFDNQTWWHIRGECANGTVENHGGWHERELYIIDSAITHIQEGIPQ